MFQSHAGSIEAWAERVVILFVALSFNPTLVRLRLVREPQRGELSDSFNPTLVRLRQLFMQVLWGCAGTFQSHAGSIEASDSVAFAVAVAVFQSHAGSIEAPPPARRPGGPAPFQSHAGSIEATMNFFDTSVEALFQSHAGSIEAE